LDVTREPNGGTEGGVSLYTTSYKIASRKRFIIQRDARRQMGGVGDGDVEGEWEGKRKGGGAGMGGRGEEVGRGSDEERAYCFYASENVDNHERPQIVCLLTTLFIVNF